MLLLNKDWLAVLENRALAILSGEDKHLIWLQAWEAVRKGEACWLQRWHAVTWGSGPDEFDRVDNTGRKDYGGDDRFVDGRLQPRRTKRLSSQLDTEGIHSPQ